MMKANRVSQGHTLEVSNSTGLQFITTTQSHQPDHADRKAIKSHIMRMRHKSNRTRQGLPSWVNNESGGTTSARERCHTTNTLIPPRVGSDLSLIQFPEPMKSYMFQDIVKCMYRPVNPIGFPFLILTNSGIVLTVARDNIYPLEVCLEIDPVATAWFGCLMNDVIFFHLALFSMQTFANWSSGKDPSPLTLLHCGTALRLLRQRLSGPNIEESTSDATIMVVMALAGVAEFLGDREATLYHRDGIFKMVSLRGGLRALNWDSGILRTKVCRVDLITAMSFGCSPLFFREGLSWDSYIATHGMIRRGDVAVDEETATFFQTVDNRLVNVWKDLHEFSVMSNLAYQTKRKINPRMYNDIMLSIFYRLLYLSFENEPFNEVIRVGMIAFASTMFLKWRGTRRRFDYQANALLKMQTLSGIPSAIQLWLCFICAIYADTILDTDWHTTWQNKTVGLVHVRNWNESRKVLKSVMWIDFLHDPHGKRIFEGLVERKVIEVPAPKQ